MGDRSELTVRGAANYQLPRDHVLVAEPPIGKPVRVSYPVPESEIVLRHRTREIRARLRGDSVVAMDDFGAALTFFEPIGG